MDKWKKSRSASTSVKPEEELSLVEKVLVRVSPHLPKRARALSNKKLMRMPHVSSSETQITDISCSISDSPFRILQEYDFVIVCEIIFWIKPGNMKRLRQYVNTSRDRLRLNYRKQLIQDKDTIDLDDTVLSDEKERLGKETLEVASKGNVEEFQKLYEADNARLNVTDAKGCTATHKAAEFGRIGILQFIKEHEGDLNVQDKLGNTPLHVAVRVQQTSSIDFLIQNGADTAVLNDDELAPIHLAVELNCVTALKTLLTHDEVDPNLRGEKGLLPLHYCAYKDRDECTKILLEGGAKPCKKCDNGFFPINIAGKCAAAKTLEVLIRHVESLGYKREDILTFSDKENNMPLHCAVNSGDLKAVEVCLSAGAPVDAKQEDNSTPLHFACAQGSIDMVKMMHDMQTERFQNALHTQDVLKMTPLHRAALFDHEDNSTPLHFACAQGSIDMVKMMHDMQTERFQNALHTQDVLKMTPLHRAALFDHVGVVQYLIDKGADIDAQEVHDRTPLLVSSSKGAWRTVHFLLGAGSNITIKDKENRNFLHLAIKYGNSIDNFGCEVLKGVKNLLNERDDFGCTPLHYASKEGHLVAIDDLLKLGATINPKDNDKKSPFHFAAKYGRYNTCKRLLDSEMGPNIINETDGDGLSALHIAAQNGHTKIITLLMQRGAYVTKDNSDNSPLHLAAANGYTRSMRDNSDNSPLHLAASNGYTRSMRLLLTVYPNLLDCVTKEGDTALHLAAKNNHVTAVEFLMTLGACFLKNQVDDTYMDIIIRERHTEVAFAVIRHERWEEVLQLCSKEYDTPINGLIQYLPEACMAAMDRCVVTSKHDRRSTDFNVHYNFRYLQCPLKYLKGRDKENRHHQPMLALNTMVRHGRVHCLAHPLSEAFLQMKWRAYGSWFHVSNLVVYAVFLALLTVLVTTCTYQYEDPIINNTNVSTNKTNVSNINNLSDDETIRIQSCEFTTTHRICVYVVFIFSCLNMLKEIAQIIQQKKKYFLDFTNCLEWILYASTMLYIVPFITNNMLRWQWEAGAMAIFLAWVNLLLYLQRFDLFGIYVVMFLEILRTLLQVLCVFSILLIAFGMSFFLLMHKEPSNAFSTPGISILRSAMMMLELDYMASFNDPYTDDDPKTLFFGGTVIVLLVVFTLLMPILLMNLLIGLAVGDIESVQKNATLKRLAMQVELHTNLEAKLPMKILSMVDKSDYTYYPNKCSGTFQKFWSKLSFLGDSSDEELVNQQQAHLFEEMYKQKMRIKEISQNMSKQYDLLRLIVQKMEIHSEADNLDEGVPHDGFSNLSKWKPAKQNILRQSAIVAHWKNSMNDDCT